MYVEFEKEMFISTDASVLCYGTVLEQKFKKSDDEADAVRPIEYFSKNYTSAQKKYPTSEKELLAIVMDVEHFHPIVLLKALYNIHRSSSTHLALE